MVPDLPYGHLQPRVARAAAASLPYDGGPVLHSNRTHVIFWEPAGSGLRFPAGYEQTVETFLKRVAHDSHLPTNVYSLTGQYSDSTGHAVYASRYGGATVDTDPLPTRDPSCVEPAPPPLDTGPGWSDCVTDNQLNTEVRLAIVDHHLPIGPNEIYFMLTPDGLGSCITSALQVSCALGGPAHNGYCGYHSDSGRNVLYAVIPYVAVSGHCEYQAGSSPVPNASPADPALSDLSHEHSEVITDPIGTAWIDSNGEEDGDLCIDTGTHPPPVLGGHGTGRYDQVIDGGRYWLQMEWSNDEGGCAARDERDRVRITTGRGGLAVAHARDPDGRIVRYDWLRRGRRVAHGRRVRLGPGRVTLRTTDSAGNYGFAVASIRG